MILAAAVIAGLALGALMPTAEAGLMRGIRIAALLILILSAVAAWPIISPDDNWPGLAFGLAAVAGSCGTGWVERRLDVAAADRAAAL